MPTGSRAVELPDHVHARVENRLPRTDFETVDDYVTYVLEAVLAEVEDATPESHDDVDEAEIQRRLQSLGYLEQ
jgi:Arc/MetJ-type ribon-helix-helix transcriptional regulator